jgi:hypothetical protein
VALPTLILILSPGFLQGQDGPLGISPAIGVTIGTSGIGGELSARLHERLGARLGVSWIPIEPEIDEDEHDVTGSAEPPSPIIRLMADFFPWGGSFHLTAGVEHFSGGLTLHGIPSDSVEIGDNKYSAEEIGEIEGTFWGSETAPYFGIGWQKVTGRVQPYFELGAALTGAPKASIRILGPAAGQVDLEEDLEEEIRELEDDASSFIAYPHLMFGLRVRLGG